MIALERKKRQIQRNPKTAEVTTSRLGCIISDLWENDKATTYSSEMSMFVKHVSFAEV